MRYRTPVKPWNVSLKPLPCLLLMAGLTLPACQGPDAKQEPRRDQASAAPVASNDGAAADDAGGAGQRHKGEEGKMGKPTSKQKSGLYAMKGPKNAVPMAAREMMADEEAEPMRARRGKRKPSPSSVAPPPPPVIAPPVDDASGEGYQKIEENKFESVSDEPLSTFSIDVDTASYSNMRRFLNDGVLPPVDAIRIEEFINYFNYNYPAPTGEHPFSVTTEVASAPWNPTHRLVQIGIRGKPIAADQSPPRNLVFLFDVSGSMNSADKLPLLKRGMSLLVRELRPEDRVSIVVYAGASGLVLPPTPGSQRATILDALAKLEAGGSTNGGQGIELAYAVAQKNFDPKAINRVILATDGDFNVGTRDRAALENLIEEKRKTGTFLTVLGFGRGNVKDSTMEMLADKGNGNYAYIDSVREAEKVLVREAGSTLVTIAKDVKIQVEFNPRMVSSYRLIGYENRALAARDFNDDTKDAGEIGAGTTVTALYEVVPAGAGGAGANVDPLKYQKPETTAAAETGELMTVKFRYKQPDADTSTLITEPVKDTGKSFDGASEDLRLAAGVAAFGMLMRGSEHAGDATFDTARKYINGALGQDPHGDRKELLQLIDKAKAMPRRASTRGR